MSVVEKCMKYAIAHGGEVPSYEEIAKYMDEQLKEFLEILSKAVTPEYTDRAILTAAYKLIYESRYSMLDQQDKEFCDKLVKRFAAI